MPLNLPDIPNLLRISKAIAMLDAIISPDWQYRYYSFNSKWSPGEQLASMRNGSGDAYFILFNQHGAILKGFAHEDPAAECCVKHGAPLPGMFNGIPRGFETFLTEPAFSINDTTFCYWRGYEDRAWNSGTARYPAKSDGGSSELLAVLGGDPGFYTEWARNYFEQPVDVSAVERVFRHESLNGQIVRSFNSQNTLEQLRCDIEGIGYNA